MPKQPASCGPLKPQPKDEEIPLDTPAAEVLTSITLHCDDSGGVFFFRYKAKLYMRLVQVGDDD